MEKVTVNIEGMSCGHCVSAVTGAVQGLDGVSGVKVSLEEKTAVVEFDSSKVSLGQIKAAIEDQGFDVV